MTEPHYETLELRVPEEERRPKPMRDWTREEWYWRIRMRVAMIAYKRGWRRLGHWFFWG